MEERPKTIIYNGVRYTINKGYYKTTYALHRRVWEDNFGEIPLDHHIHHKNGDSLDNRIENLECIHKKKHHSMHFSAMRQIEALHRKESRDKAKMWFCSKEGKKKMGELSKRGWSNRKPVKKVCVICGSLFQTKNLTPTRYCSQACRSRSAMLRKVTEKNCVVCSKRFFPRCVRNLGKTCSQKCKGVLISQSKRAKKNDSFSQFK